VTGLVRAISNPASRNADDQTGTSIHPQSWARERRHVKCIIIMSTTSLLAGVAGEYLWPQNFPRPSTCIRSSRCCWKGRNRDGDRAGFPASDERRCDVSLTAEQASAVLSPSQLEKIHAMLSEGVTQKSIGTTMDVDQSVISRIKTGDRRFAEPLIKR
jgi:hypothetical protein